MSDAKAVRLLDAWIKEAEKKVPFLMGDEPVLMHLVNYMKLTGCAVPMSYYVQTPFNTGDFAYWKTNPDALLYHQYDFINPLFQLPNDDLFSPSAFSGK